MKKKIYKILFFCFLLFGFTSKNYAQEHVNTDLKHVDSLAQKMFVDLNNRDFDAILNMTHPKVFEILPKESMKSVIKTMFEGNEDFSIAIPEIIPKYKLSELFKSEENHLKYVFVSYDMTMKMTFNKQEFNDESKQIMIPMMAAKGMDVEFISNNTMDIFMKDTMTIILKDDTTNDKWVMVNYDPDSPLFYKIVPSSLMEKAKDYKQDLMLERKKSSEN